MKKNFYMALYLACAASGSVECTYRPTAAIPKGVVRLAAGDGLKEVYGICRGIKTIKPVKAFRPEARDFSCCVLGNAGVVCLPNMPLVTSKTPYPINAIVVANNVFPNIDRFIAVDARNIDIANCSFMPQWLCLADFLNSVGEYSTNIRGEVSVFAADGRIVDHHNIDGIYGLRSSSVSGMGIEAFSNPLCSLRGLSNDNAYICYKLNIGNSAHEARTVCGMIMACDTATVAQLSSLGNGVNSGALLSYLPDWSLNNEIFRNRDTVAVESIAETRGIRAEQDADYMEALRVAQQQEAEQTPCVARSQHMRMQYTDMPQYQWTQSWSYVCKQWLDGASRTSLEQKIAKYSRELGVKQGAESRYVQRIMRLDPQLLTNRSIVEQVLMELSAIVQLCNAQYRRAPEVCTNLLNDALSELHILSLEGVFSSAEQGQLMAILENIAAEELRVGYGPEKQFPVQRWFAIVNELSLLLRGIFGRDTSIAEIQNILRRLAESERESLIFFLSKTHNEAKITELGQRLDLGVDLSTSEKILAAVAQPLIAKLEFSPSLQRCLADSSCAGLVHWELFAQLAQLRARRILELPEDVKPEVLCLSCAIMDNPLPIKGVELVQLLDRLIEEGAFIVNNFFEPIKIDNVKIQAVHHDLQRVLLQYEPYRQKQEELISKRSEWKAAQDEVQNSLSIRVDQVDEQIYHRIAVIMGGQPRQADDERRQFDWQAWFLSLGPVNIGDVPDNVLSDDSIRTILNAELAHFLDFEGDRAEIIGRQIENYWNTIFRYTSAVCEENRLNRELQAIEENFRRMFDGSSDDADVAFLRAHSKMECMEQLSTAVSRFNEFVQATKDHIKDSVTYDFYRCVITPEERESYCSTGSYLDYYVECMYVWGYKTVDNPDIDLIELPGGYIVSDDSIFPTLEYKQRFVCNFGETLKGHENLLLQSEVRADQKWSRWTIIGQELEGAIQDSGKRESFMRFVYDMNFHRVVCLSYKFSMDAEPQPMWDLYLGEMRLWLREKFMFAPYTPIVSPSEYEHYTVASDSRHYSLDLVTRLLKEDTRRLFSSGDSWDFRTHVTQRLRIALSKLLYALIRFDQARTPQALYDGIASDERSMTSTIQRELEQLSRMPIEQASSFFVASVEYNGDTLTMPTWADKVSQVKKDFVTALSHLQADAVGIDRIFTIPVLTAFLSDRLMEMSEILVSCTNNRDGRFLSLMDEVTAAIGSLLNRFAHCPHGQYQGVNTFAIRFLIDRITSHPDIIKTNFIDVSNVLSYLATQSVLKKTLTVATTSCNHALPAANNMSVTERALLKKITDTIKKYSADVEQATYLGEITRALESKYGIARGMAAFPGFRDLRRLYVSIASQTVSRKNNGLNLENIDQLLQYNIETIRMLRNQVPHSVLDRTLYNMLEYLAQNMHLDFRTAIIGLAERAVTAQMLLEQYLQSFGDTILPLLYDSFRNWQREDTDRGTVQEIPYERLDEESKKALIFDMLVASGLLERSGT